MMALVVGRPAPIALVLSENELTGEPSLILPPPIEAPPADRDVTATAAAMALLTMIGAAAVEAYVQRLLPEGVANDIGYLLRAERLLVLEAEGYRADDVFDATVAACIVALKNRVAAHELAAREATGPVQ